MQKKTTEITKKGLLLASIIALLSIVPASNLFACGYGSQGGADYVPQRRGGDQQQQQVAQRKSLSPDEAQHIVSQYIKPINPNLTVGQPNDAGAYFEIDLLSQDGEVIQVIGVDKYTGRLQPLS